MTDITDVLAEFDHPPVPDPALATRRELAATLGVHMLTIAKWERGGMPVHERGRNGRPSLFNVADVQAWLAARDLKAKELGGSSLVETRAVKEGWQARLAEHRFHERARRLIPANEVERAWAAEAARITATLSAWQSPLADRLMRAAKTDGLAGVERTLDDAVRDVLRELSGVEEQ